MVTSSALSRAGPRFLARRCANVDADDAALARVDVKKCWAAAAPDGFTDRTFED